MKVNQHNLRKGWPWLQEHGVCLETHAHRAHQPVPQGERAPALQGPGGKAKFTCCVHCVSALKYWKEEEG